MDKIKIGNFIVSCRKEKQLTQEQLAERLNISNKSISKWENGNCLPDATLYEPLCSILEISINELFAGQRIQMEDYKRIADDNLLKMLKYKLYDLGDRSITFEEFDAALGRIAELITKLKSFDTKENAAEYWVKETNASKEECSKVYDFYINLL